LAVFGCPQVEEDTSPGEGQQKAGSQDTGDVLAPECGNGVVETGEDCDDPLTDDLCLENCTLRVGNCHGETPWDEIALSLFGQDEDGLLPLLPGDHIDPPWGLPTPEFLTHNISPEERFPGDDIFSEDCEPPVLWDFGYGELTGDRYLTWPDHNPDQNPTGHSTLVILEAYREGEPSTNTSQFDGRDGILEIETVDGHEILLLNGSEVYGRDDPALGWMEHLQRRVLALESGHMILIDDLLV